MAIFPVLQVESKIQVGDQTRLDASRTFVTQDEADISLLEIKPLAAGDWIDVTSTKYLDWSYSTAETVTVSARVTTDGSPSTSTITIEVVSSATDNLFSSDTDLLAWESDILKYVRDGRNSFKDIHRESQKQILDWFDGQGIRVKDGERLTAADVIDVQELKEWSKFLTLQIIFEGLSNAVDDVFMQKAKKYESLAVKARNRSDIRLDLDNDGDAETDERSWIAGVNVRRV